MNSQFSFLPIFDQIFFYVYIFEGFYSGLWLICSIYVGLKFISNKVLTFILLKIILMHWMDHL